MKVVKTQRYLEDVISSSGSLRDTIEDRRLGETLQDFWDPCRNARHPKSRGWPQPEDGQVDQLDDLLQRGLGQDLQDRADKTGAG